MLATQSRPIELEEDIVPLPNRLEGGMKMNVDLLGLDPVDNSFECMLSFGLLDQNVVAWRQVIC